MTAEELEIPDQLDSLLPTYKDFDRKFRFDLFCSASMLCHSAGDYVERNRLRQSRTKARAQRREASHMLCSERNSRQGDTDPGHAELPQRGEAAARCRRSRDGFEDIGTDEARA